MRRARFRVTGRFDGGVRAATVEIDKSHTLISVRPYMRRRVYTLLLADVANTVIYQVVRAEMRAQRAAKRAARRGNQ